MKSSKSRDTTSQRIPIAKALIWIFSSSLIISGSCAIALLYYQHLREERRHDPKYQIVAIVQTSHDKESLKTAYLAELLDLSLDNPSNLYAFSAKQSREKLLRSPVIKKAVITKIRPGMIWVDYELRKPRAFLGDYTNTAIDAEAVAFPFNPFFTPKTLPEIYLGISQEDSSTGEDERHFHWGTALQGKRIDLAFSVLELAIKKLSSASTSVSTVDVSKAFCSSCGQRQIVLILEDRLEKIVEGQPVLRVFPRILRLGTDNYGQQLENFVILHDYLRQHENGLLDASTGNTVQIDATIIDLRLSDLAFITTGRL